MIWKLLCIMNGSMVELLIVKENVHCQRAYGTKKLTFYALKKKWNAVSKFNKFHLPSHLLKVDDNRKQIFQVNVFSVNEYADNEFDKMNC